MAEPGRGAGALAGDERSRLLLTFTVRALDQLRKLTEPPSEDTETATLRWVRQSRRYPLWRVSHAYDPQAAVRLICWFPPGHRHGRRCLVRRRQGPPRGRVLRRGSRPRRPADRPVEARDGLRGEAMTDRQPATPDQARFARGNARLDELLADPELAADVAAARADAEEMDRVYAMNLAMIRQAAQHDPGRGRPQARRRPGRRIPPRAPRRHAALHPVRLPDGHRRRRRRHRRRRPRPAHRAGPRLDFARARRPQPVDTRLPVFRPGTPGGGRKLSSPRPPPRC